MAYPTPRLCVISDETGPKFDDFLNFAVEVGLNAVEIRQIDGINPLSLTPAERKATARKIEAADLRTAGIATPLLKWLPPGKTSTDVGDQFGFDRSGRTDRQLFENAIAIADDFSTRYLRIFSYLSYDGFEIDDLRQDLDKLLELAERYDKVLRVENEPVCNIAHVSQLADLLEAYDTPRLCGIPDVANSFYDGNHPTEADIARVMKYATHIHIKDYSIAQKRYVALGKGDCPTAQYLRQMLDAADKKPLTLSIETHVPEAPLEATRSSLAELRSILDHIANDRKSHAPDNTQNP